MKSLSNRDLKKICHRFCHDWFLNIPVVPSIRFGKNEENEEGTYCRGDNEIIIDYTLARHPDLACIVVLHELAHCSLGVGDTEYKGIPPFFDHGPRFQAELVRLFLAGAYDQLL